MSDMRVEHLRAAVMNPLTLPGLPAHVFLLHTDDGLVLVDTGFGTADVTDPARRFGPIRHLLRPDGDPDRTVLHQLRARGLDADAVIERRLANAREELSHAPEFDYVIINDVFETARRDLLGVLRAERVRTARQLARHPGLFQA